MTRRVTRRAQLEMIGLVFIVIVIVLGIVLYIAMSSRSPAKDDSRRSLGSTSFLTALSKTDVPACGAKLSVVAAMCADGKQTALCEHPCETLNDVFTRITTAANLGDRYKYELALTNVGTLANPGSIVHSLSPSGQTDVLVSSDCSSAANTPKAGVYQTLVSGSSGQYYIKLTLCR